MTESQQLLAEYAQTGSEAAFRELVTRYLDLVYSAAVRLVNGDRHLAQDVTQRVFSDLARMARALSPQVMLGGWLHRHTCFVAGNIMRAERRRQARERQAVEMNALEDHSAANLALLAPILDEAINHLGAEDRAAILLRFFEQKDFHSVGQSLGSTEEAARKRVDRALAKLRLLLGRRGVALSATTLAATLATQTLSAAPAGLAATVSATALAGAAATGGAFATILQLIGMTKLKIGIISTLVVAGIAVPVVVQQRTQKELRETAELLRQQSEQNDQLALENEQLAKRAAQPAAPAADPTGPSRELLRLRGEIGRLRQEQTEAKAAVTHEMVETRYKRAGELARQGDGPGALAEFLWCFDTGMRQVASYGGVRSSFLLNAIAELGAEYPPALTALRERRDQASARMLASPNDRGAARDFAALSRTLKEDQTTLAVFDQLPPDDPRRPTLASAAYEQLVQAQRYGDALLGKPYAQMSSLFELMIAERPLPANVANPEAIQKTQRQQLVNSTARNVEVLAGAGDLEHARMLAARLQAFDPSPATRALLQQHALRAGQPDLLNGVPNP